MIEEANSTYLEDFLQCLEPLPNIFRRDCELMRDLDRDIVEINKQILKTEESILSNQRRIGVLPDGSPEKADLGSSIGQLLQTRSSLCTAAQQKMSCKKVVTQGILAALDEYQSKLDVDLVAFERELLYTSGDYIIPTGIPATLEVAFRFSVDHYEKTLALGTVQRYRSELASYEIVDVDDGQSYLLPESQVYELAQADNTKKLTKGELIHALYPDTTIFYPATIMQAPRRTLSSTNLASLASTSSAPPTSATAVASAEGFLVTVQFQGDEDIDGNVPCRTIPLKYIVRAPQYL